ncbi:hypothetical protein FA13DRAFT_1263975 [Coprinellus micaceus]|uniref:Fungal-type protein kinase domain-containing protein n=1 Tax=Coprinellus micaceus TaxID=71717 RepID=A0A4Y7R8Q4_COPMI|nr:hypothetical protein FA13DRAFT_1263975 [Coprinellus micaceus]
MNTTVRAEEKRAGVASFGADHLFRNIGGLDLIKRLSKGRNVPTSMRSFTSLRLCFTQESFIDQLNTLSARIRDTEFPGQDVVVAKNGEHLALRDPPVDTLSQPAIILAPQSKWVEGGNITSWSWVDLVGEELSRGDGDPDLKTHTYIHYWLLARPDRNAALASLTTPDTLVVYLAFQGSPTTLKAELDWTDTCLLKLLVVVLHCLYEPGPFGMSAYVRANTESSNVFDLQIRKHRLLGLTPTYSCCPFQTRTHILVRVEGCPIGKQTVRVIKDQLNRTGKRCKEADLYEWIHSGGRVPGVAQLVLKHAFPSGPDLEAPGRCRDIIGLQEYGQSITQAGTLLDVLKILYDLVELTRFLRVHRHVLHRDISVGNVMFVPHAMDPKSVQCRKRELDECERTKDLESVCFINHLLDSKAHVYDTSLLLIDFNNAKILVNETGDETENVERIRIGTPGFIARAVHRNGPAPCYDIDESCEGPKYSATTQAPKPYAEKHPARVEKFPPSEAFRLESFPDQSPQDWRHDLEHEVESAFWLLFYWLMMARPVGLPGEDIPSGTWSSFSGEPWQRDNILRWSFMPEDKACHSLYTPVKALLRGLSAVLLPDRCWLPTDNVQSDVEYVAEVFQRQVLAFVLKHQADEFMLHKVDIKKHRALAKTPQVPAHSARVTLFMPNQYVESKKHGLKEGDELEQSEVDLRFLSRHSQASP